MSSAKSPTILARAQVMELQALATEAVRHLPALALEPAVRSRWERDAGMLVDLAHRIRNRLAQEQSPRDCYEELARAEEIVQRMRRESQWFGAAAQSSIIKTRRAAALAMAPPDADAEAAAMSLSRFRRMFGKMQILLVHLGDAADEPAAAEDGGNPS